MAAKRFEKKIYECWALQTRGGKLHETYSKPHLYPTKEAVLGIAYTDELAVPVRVTVERIERKKKETKR